MLSKRTSKNQITLPKAIVAGFEDIEYFKISQHMAELSWSQFR